LEIFKISILCQLIEIDKAEKKMSVRVYNGMKT